jgi:hypothetical protein
LTPPSSSKLSHHWSVPSIVDASTSSSTLLPSPLGEGAHRRGVEASRTNQSPVSPPTWRCKHRWGWRRACRITCRPLPPISPCDIFAPPQCSRQLYRTTRSLPGSCMRPYYVLMPCLEPRTHRIALILAWTHQIAKGRRQVRFQVYPISMMQILANVNFGFRHQEHFSGTRYVDITLICY